jgi:hypothetical protein
MTPARIYSTGQAAAGMVMSQHSWVRLGQGLLSILIVADAPLPLLFESCLHTVCAVKDLMYRAVATRPQQLCFLSVEGRNIHVDQY